MEGKGKAEAHIEDPDDAIMVQVTTKGGYVLLPAQWVSKHTRVHAVVALVRSRNALTGSDLQLVYVESGFEVAPNADDALGDVWCAPTPTSVLTFTVKDAQSSHDAVTPTTVHRGSEGPIHWPVASLVDAVDEDQSMRIVLLGAAPPGKDARGGDLRGVYPEGIGHRLSDCVEKVCRETSHLSLAPVSLLESVIGVRKAHLERLLVARRPTVLMLCMHFEALPGKPDDKRLHFGEYSEALLSNGVQDQGHDSLPGLMTAQELASVLRAYQDKHGTLQCVVLLACDCGLALGPTLSQALSGTVRRAHVIGTTRRLYQQQAEEWTWGFVTAACEGKTMASAMVAGRKYMNAQLAEETAKADSLPLRDDTIGPLFLCYCGHSHDGAVHDDTNDDGTDDDDDGSHVDAHGAPVNEPTSAACERKPTLLRTSVPGIYNRQWGVVRDLLRQPYTSAKKASSSLADYVKRAQYEAYVPTKLRLGGPQADGLVNVCSLGNVWNLAEQQKAASQSLSTSPTAVPIHMVGAHHMVVVEGPAGVGKSTIAARLALDQGCVGWPDVIRAVAVVDLSRLDRSREPTLPDLLRRAFCVPELDVPRTEKWLLDHQAEVVWVLDSYDDGLQLAGADRTDFHQWLGRVATGAVAFMHRVMLFTRPGHGVAFPASALCVGLDPWGTTSVELYIDRFAKLVKPSTAREAFKHQARHVLVNNPNLPPTFAGIPVVCSIACHLSARGELQTEQSIDVCRLYGRMVDMIWHMEDEAGRQSSEVVKAVLSSCVLYYFAHDHKLPPTDKHLKLDHTLRRALEVVARRQLAPTHVPAAFEGKDNPILIGALETVRLRSFAAVKVCWAVSGGVVHRAVMEYLVASAIQERTLAEFKDEVNTLFELREWKERMVLLYLADFMARADGKEADAKTGYDVPDKRKHLLTVLIQLVGQKFRNCKGKYAVQEEIDASFQRREALRSACGVTLVLEVAARAKPGKELVSAVSTLVYYKSEAVLERVLLEPAARFGLLPLVKFLVPRSRTPNTLYVEALRAARATNQSHVIAWCVAKGAVEETAYDLRAVAKGGNHRLLLQLLAVPKDANELRNAVRAAARQDQVDAVRVLIDKGGAQPSDALEAALDAFSFNTCRVAITRYKVLPNNMSFAVARAVQSRAWEVAMLLLLHFNAKRLDLSACATLTFDRMCGLEMGLRMATTLRSLDLSSCPLDHAQPASLVSVLKQVSTLQKLILSDEDDVGVTKHAFGAMAVNLMRILPRLTSLELRDVHVGHNVVTIVENASSSLTRLDVRRSHITQYYALNTIKELAHNTSLTALDLRGNRLVKAAALGNYVLESGSLAMVRCLLEGTLVDGKPNDATMIAAARHACEAKQEHARLQPLLRLLAHVGGADPVALFFAARSGNNVDMMQLCVDEFEVSQDLLRCATGQNVEDVDPWVDKASFIACNASLPEMTPGVQGLNLSQRAIHMDVAHILVPCMRLNASLCSLHLNTSALTDEECMNLVASVRRHSALTDLQLYGCDPVFTLQDYGLAKVTDTRLRARVAQQRTETDVEMINMLREPYPVGMSARLTGGSSLHALGHLFVPPTVCLVADHDMMAQEGYEREHGWEMVQGEAVALEMLWKPGKDWDDIRRIVLEGVAGAGKSALAHMVAAHQGMRGWPEEVDAVVLVNLYSIRCKWNEHEVRQPDDVGTAPSVEQVLRWQLGVGPATATNLARWLTQNRERTVWILDAFDQAEWRPAAPSSPRASQQRNAFDAWIDAIVADAFEPSLEPWSTVFHRVIILSRPCRNRLVFANAIHFELNAWSEDSIREYAHHFVACSLRSRRRHSAEDGGGMDDSRSRGVASRTALVSMDKGKANAAVPCEDKGKSDAVVLGNDDHGCGYVDDGEGDGMPHLYDARVSSFVAEGEGERLEHLLLSEVLLNRRLLPLDVCGIPYVCEMVCTMMLDRLPLPKGRTHMCQLYKELMEGMWRHDRDTGRPDSLLLRRVVALYALHMHTTGGVAPTCVQDLGDKAVRQLETMAQEARESQPSVMGSLQRRLARRLRFRNKRVGNEVQQAFEDVQLCWALGSRGRLAHTSITQHLVGSAMAMLSLADFKVVLGPGVDSVLLTVLLADSLHQHREQCTERLGEGGTAQANEKMRHFAVVVARQLASRFGGCAAPSALELLGVSYDAREALREACDVDLAAVALALLGSRRCNTLFHQELFASRFKRFVLSSRPLQPLRRVLLEPCAAYGNLHMVKLLLNGDGMGSAGEAMRAACYGGWDDVVQWCQERDGGNAPASELDLPQVAAVGYHPLIPQCWAALVQAGQATPALARLALQAAAARYQVGAVRALVRTAHARPADALAAVPPEPSDAAVAASDPSRAVRKCCWDELGAGMDIGAVAALARRHGKWSLLSEALKRNAVITALDLANMDASLGLHAFVILNSTSLTRLDLRGNDFGVEGARELSRVLVCKQLPRLRWLSLQGNGIGDEGCLAMARSVVACTALTRLNLCGNGILSSGAECMAGALPHASLSLLDMCWNRLNEAACASLRAAGKQCPSLHHLLLQHQGQPYDVPSPALASPIVVSHDAEQKAATPVANDSCPAILSILPGPVVGVGGG